LRLFLKTQLPMAVTKLPALIKAKPAHQRSLVYLTLGLLSFGWIVIHGTEHYLDQLQRILGTTPAQGYELISQVLLLVTTVMVLSLACFASWIGQFSYRTLREQRFPPTGFWVVRDTPVIEGWRAVVRAGAGFLLSALAILGGISISAQLVEFLALFQRT
jgi:uncharacterized BrkB/YihY/UPF0761 family membrane protein